VGTEFGESQVVHDRVVLPWKGKSRECQDGKGKPGFKTGSAKVYHTNDLSPYQFVCRILAFLFRTRWNKEKP